MDSKKKISINIQGERDKSMRGFNFNNAKTYYANQDEQLNLDKIHSPKNKEILGSKKKK